MHPASPPIAGHHPPPHRVWHVAWIGGSPGSELAWCRQATARLACVSDVDGPPSAAVDPESIPGRPVSRAEHEHHAEWLWPTVVVLATDAPGRWNLDDAITVARRWPLAQMVSVATSLNDGRRRSGPALPGVEEIAWHEFPARLAAWLADLDAGLPGALGLPPAVRREDRLLQIAGGVARWRGRWTSRVTIAAADQVAVEGLADVVAAMGHAITTRTVGRPPVDVPSEVVVWEVSVIDGAVIAWLRLLASQQPGRRVVVVEAFPRDDGVLAALRAGATAVLGRPLGLEALGGALLLRDGNTGQTALGPGSRPR